MLKVWKFRLIVTRECLVDKTHNEIGITKGHSLNTFSRFSSAVGVDNTGFHTIATSVFSLNLNPTHDTKLKCNMSSFTLIIIGAERLIDGGHLMRFQHGLSIRGLLLSAFP